MKGFNLKVQELREALVREINESKLPISVSVMVVGEVLDGMKKAEQQMIAVERKSYEKEGAENEEIHKD